MPDPDARRVRGAGPFTRAEAAEYLGLGLRTLDRLVAARLVGFTKLGPHRRSPIRFDRAALDDYLARRSVAPRVHTGVDRRHLVQLAERAEKAVSDLRAALADLGAA